MLYKSVASIGVNNVSIYEVRYYGVFFRYKLEFSGVNIYTRKEELHRVPGFENSFFEITVLEEYEGKKDVLKLEFEDGELAYETLNYPFLYLDIKDNVWKKSNDRSTPEAFMKAYINSN